MARREIHGHIILDAEGCVDRGQRLVAERAICREGPSARLVVTGTYGVELGALLAIIDDARVPRPLARWALSGEHRAGVAVPYLPGASFTSILAQTREQGAFLAVDVAAAIVCEVAAAGAAVDRALPSMALDPRPQVEQLGPSHVRIGFEEGLQIFPAPVLDDMRDIIGPGTFGVEFRRSTERGLAYSPEHIIGVGVGPPSTVYILGSLLFIAAGGRFPWQETNPLEFLQAFHADPALPSLGHVAPEVNALIAAATARRPEDRPEDPNALCAALARIADVDLGRRALPGIAANLFPEERRSQLAFVEEAPFFDITVVDRVTAPVHPPPHTPEVLWFGPLGCDASPVSHGAYARFLAETGHPRPAHYVDVPEIAHEPIILVSNEDAAAYAAWAGGSLPTDLEWQAIIAAWAPLRRSVGRVWEWTSTPRNDGHVVRGGPWRDQGGQGIVDNRSWENVPAADVGFRVFYRSTAPPVLD